MQCKTCGEPATHAFRCDEHQRCDDCGKTEGLCYRGSGLRCEACHRKFIERAIADFDGDTEYTSEAVCPWCGNVDGDSWELRGDDGVHTCGECEREFHYTRDVQVTYSTKRGE